jgi:DNA-binding FrmR family transcriptional regulator
MSAEAADGKRAMSEEDARILNRLARIEGQIRGLQRMIEEGKDCEDILAQLAAAKSALDRVGTHLISHHMKECLEDEMGVQLDPVALEKAFDVFFKYVQCMRS